MSGYTHFEGGFSGRYFAFSAACAPDAIAAQNEAAAPDSPGAEKLSNQSPDAKKMSNPPPGAPVNTGSREAIFAVVDTVDLVQTGGFDSMNPYGVQADESGIYVQTENLLVKIHPVTGDQTPLVTTGLNIMKFARGDKNTIIATHDEFMFFDGGANLLSRHKKEYGSDLLQIAEGVALIGSLDSPVLRIIKHENHSKSGVFSYDPSIRHGEARISADGATVMLFSFDRFHLFDIDGKLIAAEEIPDAGNVYDQQYRRDDSGSRLEVVYYDGAVRAYSAADGSIMYEMAGEAPDRSLYEEFTADGLRIKSGLHEVPKAYDLKTGRLVRELEKDGHLTYVTQVGEYIITQYISASEDFYYGYLLNKNCETLAYLPYLCDIYGDSLIFDYPSGDLRKSRIYDFDSLVDYARSLSDADGK
jgi:hypothetical protein